MAKAVECPICGGLGTIIKPSPLGSSSANEMPINSHSCGGRGWVENERLRIEKLRDGIPDLMESYQPIERSLRYRVQVSQTSTGKKSWEAVVDGEDYSQEEILAKSDSLVAELEKRYPPQ